MKIILMVGVPGAGKTTFALKYPEYKRISQDDIGDRAKCMEVFKKCLKDNKSVIIDRCNQNKMQRRNWIREAINVGATKIDCVYLMVDPEVAVKRISERKGHPTIQETTSLDKCKDIVYGFINSFQPPEIEEGFQKILIIKND